MIGPPTKPANQPSRADNNQPSNQPAEPTTAEPSRRPTSRAGQPIHPLNFTHPQASNQPTSNLRQLPTSSFSSRLCQLQFAMLSGAKPVSPPASMAFFKLCAVLAVPFGCCFAAPFVLCAVLAVPSECCFAAPCCVFVQRLCTQQTSRDLLHY